MCYSPNASFAIADRATFDAFLMRPSAGWEPGSACPAMVAATAPAVPIEISLEKADGWRTGSTYNPVILLPSGAYASFAVEIIDGDVYIGEKIS